MNREPSQVIEKCSENSGIENQRNDEATATTHTTITELRLFMFDALLHFYEIAKKKLIPLCGTYYKHLNYYKIFLFCFAFLEYKFLDIFIFYGFRSSVNVFYQKKQRSN